MKGVIPVGEFLFRAEDVCLIAGGNRESGGGRRESGTKSILMVRGKRETAFLKELTFNGDRTNRPLGDPALLGRTWFWICSFLTQKKVPSVQSPHFIFVLCHVNQYDAISR